ncbi:sugar ABC transporter permease [Mollicutes bacterium LVI A0039]|nr:sugar ABC transporter permease [Mollicutes bacterium LVI A0039]
MKRKIPTVYFFLIPWFLGVVLLKIVPFLISFVLSFTSYNLIDSPSFIGFGNYIKMFTDDPIFAKSIVATFKYAFITVPLVLVVSLMVATILNFKIKGVNFFRSVYYIPSILGGNVAVAILWQSLFANDGIINMVLGVFNIDAIPWLVNPNTALFTIGLLRAWQFGSTMVIFLAALQNVPKSLYEAAEIDGAGKIKQFFNVTLPIITPVVLFNFVMGLVHAFQEFNAPYLITDGGPMHSTYLMNMYIYESAFTTYNMGYASALSWVLFIIIMVFTLMVFRSSKYWVHYSD